VSARSLVIIGVSPILLGVARAVEPGDISELTDHLGLETGSTRIVRG
jgi:hypothetical protein